MALIREPRSLIPACDVDLPRFQSMIQELEKVGPRIGAYKIGMSLALAHGLTEVVRIAKEYTEKPLIYDHQKAGTDIPDTGREFARVLKEANIDAVILFPLAGPATFRTWVKEALDKGLKVLVGGRMTHDNFLKSDGGYVDDDSVDKIYLEAARLGVVDFVVPGNRVDFIRHIRSLIEQAGVKDPTFYAPGFVSQKGNITEAAEAAGEKWHAIVGRAIYQREPKDMRQAAEQLAAML